VLSLEVAGEDMRKLVSNLTANARVFAESRQLLGYEQVLKVVEEEKEQAQEFATESLMAMKLRPWMRVGVSVYCQSDVKVYFYFHQEPIWLEKQTNPVFALCCASYR
jgi:hypothetical protein